MRGLHRFRRPGMGEVTSVLGFGLLLALLSYRQYDFVPGPGLDPSWNAGLHLAAHSDLVYGSDLNFTYGPLGFLSVPKLYYDGTAVLAVMWLQLTRILALGAVFVVARQGLGTLAAFALTLLLGATLQAPELIFASTVALVIVLRETRHPQLRPLLVLLGVLAAITVLIKLSVGASVGAIALLAAIAGTGTRRERRNDVLLLAGAFTGPVLLLWFATGQTVGGIPEYVRTTLDIVSGYNAAMSSDVPEVVSEYTLALIVLVVGFLAIHLYAPTTSMRARRGAGAIWLVACFFQFKAGFVRHDPGHALLFFGCLPLVLLVMVSYLRSRATAFGLVLVSIAIFVSVANTRLDEMWGPVKGVSGAVEQAGDLADPTFRAREREAGRAAIAQANQLPKDVFDDVFGHSVYVHPAETSINWAYALKWRPPPVFQSYAAYTDHIDQENAERLADPKKGPERVLFRPETAIDGRYAPFDEPQLTLELLCNFQPSVAGEQWISLARTENRCGKARKLQTIHAGWNEPVTVPAPTPGTVVVANVDGVQVSGLESLRAFFYKAKNRTITLGTGSFRLIPGSGDGPLPLVASRGLDLPAPFSQIPQVATVSFGKADAPSDGKPLTVTFSAIPFQRSSAARTR